jgi:hypothetical protein
MKVLLLTFFLASATSTQAYMSSLSVADRCSIVSNVLKTDMGVRWEQGSNMTKIVRESFPEMHKGVAKVRDRVLIRAVWLIGGRSEPMFNSAEACNDDDFLLEGEKTNEEIVDADYIILMILRPTRHRNRFEFQERLSLYGPRGPGGFSVPPSRDLGVVERDGDGEWHATATKRYH